MDLSPSMMSRDTGTKPPVTRFEICLRCMRQIIRDQVLDHDMVAMLGFGNEVKTVVHPTIKAGQHIKIDEQIACLAPSKAGGTAFFDAVLEGLKLMNDPTVALAKGPRWMVCLTDGDDVGSKRDNAQGELVTKMLDSGAVPNLNMVIITVGVMAEKNVKVIKTWVNSLVASGGIGQHVSEKDASQIETAFNVVAEVLAADVGGAVEC